MRKFKVFIKLLTNFLITKIFISTFMTLKKSCIKPDTDYQKYFLWLLGGRATNEAKVTVVNY